MQLLLNINRKSITRITTMLLAVTTLSATVATSALAAGRDVGGGAFHGGAHTGRGFSGPLPDRVPSMPPPVFNPSSPYTMPQPRETPVSPASPGSIFGNG